MTFWRIDGWIMYERTRTAGSSAFWIGILIGLVIVGLAFTIT